MNGYERWELSLSHRLSALRAINNHVFLTDLWGNSQHLETGRHVGERGAGQHHVAEVHREGFAPHREVTDVENC